MSNPGRTFLAVALLGAVLGWLYGVKQRTP